MRLTQSQQFHRLLLDVNRRLTTVAATTVLLQGELEALRVALDQPSSPKRRRSARKTGRR